MSRDTKILIIKGHGGSDPGAVHDKFIEKYMNVNTATAMYDFLIKQGFTNVDLDNNETNVQAEIKLANSKDYDYILSVHYNAGRGVGFEAYCNLVNNKSSLCAAAIEKEVKNLGRVSRGIKDGNKFLIINSTKGNSIILEGGFIDNSSDSSYFDTVLEQESLGVTYARGLMKYLKVPEVHDDIKKTLYRVQVGAFSNKINAERLAKELKQKGYNTYITVK